MQMKTRDDLRKVITLLASCNLLTVTEPLSADHSLVRKCINIMDGFKIQNNKF